MKKTLITIGIAIGVTLITATVAHLLGVKDWEACFSGGVGAGVASLLTTRWQRRKLSANNHN